MTGHSIWLKKNFAQGPVAYDRIVARTLKNPELVNALLEGIGSASAPTRLGCAKALALVAGKAPELVYPHFAFFTSLLDSPNSILRWNASRAIASMAPADVDNKLEPVLEKYVSPIEGPQMIAAANAMRWSPAIALAKPMLADRIAQAILRVRDAAYATEECRNVAIGHAITALGRFYHLIANPAAVLAFVDSQKENPRSATRAKALSFLAKHGPDAARPGGPGKRLARAASLL